MFAFGTVFAGLGAFPAGVGFGALDGFGAAVIEGFYAFFPCHPMNIVQFFFMHVSGQEDVQGLCLTHEGGAVGSVFDEPALVDFKSGFEDVFFIIG